MSLSGSHGSECSCDNCENRIRDDGPNQVNFLATTNDVKELETRYSDQEAEAKKNGDNFDFNAELSRVLGAIECTLTDRKKIGESKDDDLNDDLNGDREENIDVPSAHDEIEEEDALMTDPDRVRYFKVFKVFRQLQCDSRKLDHV